MTNKKKTERKKVVEVIDRSSKRLQFIYAKNGELVVRIWIIPSPTGEGRWSGAVTAYEGDKCVVHADSASGYGYNKKDTIITDLLMAVSLEGIFDGMPAIPRHQLVGVWFLREAGFDVVES